jgi:hypothetical protein
MFIFVLVLTTGGFIPEAIKAKRLLYKAINNAADPLVEQVQADNW